jgi:hypothetical protein
MPVVVFLLPVPYSLVYLNSPRLALNLRVARKRVFLAVSSVVLNISPIVRSFSPW